MAHVRTAEWKPGYCWSPTGAQRITLKSWLSIHKNHPLVRQEIDERTHGGSRVLIVIACLHRTHGARVYVLDEVKTQEKFV